MLLEANQRPHEADTSEDYGLSDDCSSSSCSWQSTSSGPSTSSNDDEFQNESFLARVTGTVTRRRRGREPLHAPTNGNEGIGHEYRATVPRGRSRRHRRPPCFRPDKYSSSQLSSCALCFSVVVFLCTVLSSSPVDDVFLDPSFRSEEQAHSYWAHSRERKNQLSGNHQGHIPQQRNNSRYNRVDKEDIPNECEYTEWQTTSYPTCNVLHEFDLAALLRFPKFPLPNNKENSTSSYVGSGLWRDVFLLDDTLSYSAAPMAAGDTSFDAHVQSKLILKMMRTEHDTTQRNWDRHRREAMAMERLSSNPNIVQLFGYCSNTVLTEHAPMGLDKHLQMRRLHERTIPQNEHVQEDRLLKLREQLRLALEATRGLAALHDMDVIHADIQTKQFLVANDGRVMLNDFNRCRFLPRKKTIVQNLTATSTVSDSQLEGNNMTLRRAPTSLSSKTKSRVSSSNSSNSICPVYIPSAPGSWRAPEEYAGKYLDTAMDVYSLGNVLHHILVGDRPFANLSDGKIKRAVGRGEKPEYPPSIVPPPSSISTVAGQRAEEGYAEWARQFASLIDRCLEGDPRERITARSLEGKLGSLFDKVSITATTAEQRL